MHRATPLNSSFRGYVSGGSRGTVDTINDNSLMQEHAGNQMHSETRDAVESPQNYGFTSVCMPADKGSDGKMIASAEQQMSYSGGNRSFPVAGNMDDRRHRLRGLSSGDSAMHRTNSDDQQFHLTGGGNYNSAPTSKVIRSQLVPSGSGKANPPQQQSQASPTQQSVYAAGAAKHGVNLARLWAGLEPKLQAQLDAEVRRLERGSAPSVAPRAGNGSSGASNGGGSQDPGQSLKTGQQAVAGAGQDSKNFIHLDQNETSMRGKQTQLSLEDRKEAYHHVVGKEDYCGGKKGKDKFGKIITTAGISDNSYARIEEG
jgi:hypothetical protein